MKTDKPKANTTWHGSAPTVLAEQLKAEQRIYPWELCPSGWWGAAMSNGGYCWFCKIEPTVSRDNEIINAGDLVQVIDVRFEGVIDYKNAPMQIPEREKELNRLAENHETLDVPELQASKLRDAILPYQIRERRGIRMEAGLMSDEYDISQHSAEEVAETPAEPEAWDGEGLPPVGVECESTVMVFNQDNEFKHHIDEWHKLTVIGEWRGKLILLFDATDELPITEPVFTTGHEKFRPIESPEQKAEREREELTSGIYELFLSECQATDEVINHKFLAKVMADWLVKREASDEQYRQSPKKDRSKKRATRAAGYNNES